MRILISTIIMFLVAVNVSAQTASSEPDVTVLDKKWRVDIRNPQLERDPIQAMEDRERQEQQRRDNERTNDILRERGMPVPSSGVPDADRSSKPAGKTVLYVYEVKVRNNGAKGIRKLTWDYVFFEQGTETELGRRRFISRVNLSAGGTTNVVVRAAAPPTRTVAAGSAGKKPRDQYAEKIIIQRVEYADGSVWLPKSN